MKKTEYKSVTVHLESHELAVLVEELRHLHKNSPHPDTRPMLYELYYLLTNDPDKA
jgi:hypothetical protein